MNYINMSDTNCAALNYLTPAKNHDPVHHTGLGTCDWTQRLKPLLTTSTTTTTYKASASGTLLALFRRLLLNVLAFFVGGGPGPIYFCKRLARHLVQLAIRITPRGFSLHARPVTWLLCGCCPCCLQFRIAAAAAVTGNWCFKMACC